MLIFTVSILLLTIYQNECAMKATAVLRADNSVTSFGTLTFFQHDVDAPVYITGDINGLNASSAHGFHVHTNPVSESLPNCTAAAGHFNPYNTLHGPRTADIWNRHVGDLGNITTNEDGAVSVDIEDWIIQLYNTTQSILSRTVVVHRFRDDGGESGAPDSNTTGNAGARVLCGLIKLVPDEETTTTSKPSTGLNIEPMILILFMTMMIHYII